MTNLVEVFVSYKNKSALEVSELKALVAELELLLWQKIGAVKSKFLQDEISLNSYQLFRCKFLRAQNKIKEIESEQKAFTNDLEESRVILGVPSAFKREFLNVSCVKFTMQNELDEVQVCADDFVDFCDNWGCSLFVAISNYERYWEDPRIFGENYLTELRARLTREQAEIQVLKSIFSEDELEFLENKRRDY